MPIITLPDGSKRTFEGPVDGRAVALAIGPRLERDAVAIRVDGELRDLARPIDRDARVEIVTRATPDGLEMLRHDAAHVMAQAVKEIYPETQVTIGPVIEDGFYYDFACERPFTPEDLEKIEERMREIVEARPAGHARGHGTATRPSKFFREQGENYKAEIIARIPAGEPISLYGQGDWVDLCRGPHVPSTGKLGALQAHEGRRRLLARRLAQRDAAAHLRHRVADDEELEGLSAPPRGGREARSPQARPRARPVPLPGRGARRRVLASEGLDDVPALDRSTCASGSATPATRR